MSRHLPVATPALLHPRIAPPPSPRVHTRLPPHTTTTPPHPARTPRPHPGSSSLRLDITRLSRRHSFYPRHSTAPLTEPPTRTLSRVPVPRTSPQPHHLRRLIRTYAALPAAHPNRTGVLADYHWPYVDFSRYVTYRWNRCTSTYRGLGGWGAQVCVPQGHARAVLCSARRAAPT